MRNPRNYWYNLENVKKELMLMSSDTIIPSYSEIEKKKPILKKSIAYFGGLKEIAKEMGYVVQEKRQESKYWFNWDNLSKTLKEMSNNSIMPSASEIRNKLDRSVESSIQSYGGMYAVAEKLGLFIRTKKKNYWRNWDNLQNEIRRIMINDNFPSMSFIRSNLGNGAIKGIRYFGGIHSVCLKMGYQHQYSYQASDGHILDSYYELQVDEYLFKNNIPHDVHGILIPNLKFQYDFKIPYFYIEVWGYEKSEGKIRNRYNEKRSVKEKIYKHHNLPLISIESETFKSTNTQKELDVIFNGCK